MQIGISDWIIEDGNYPDFTVGQQSRFALEFGIDSIEPAVIVKNAFKSISPARYKIEATVIFLTEDAWVINCGFLAYSNHAPPAIAKLGAGIKGEIYLGVDPFFYFEDLCKIPGMPELRSDWKINSILLETTPWILGRLNGGSEIWQRDESRSSYRPVESTTIKGSDEKFGAHHILGCTKIEETLD